MNLTEEQRQHVKTWIEQGAKLGEIQTRLASEFGIKLTYMDTRFLLDDLNLTVKDPAKAPSPTADLTKAPPPPAGPGGAPIGGKVQVSVDKIVRPGAALSGSVIFSDGQIADWHLDQTGRLGLVPKTKGYQPKPADVQEFQIVLQDELARLGY